MRFLHGALKRFLVVLNCHPPYRDELAIVLKPDISLERTFLISTKNASQQFPCEMINRYKVILNCDTPFENVSIEIQAAQFISPFHVYYSQKRSLLSRAAKMYRKYLIIKIHNLRINYV